MEIRMHWFKVKKRGVTVKEFALMDIEETSPNDNGVYIDHVSVLIPTKKGLTCVVNVARGIDGYHSSTEYATATGGGGWWPSDRRCFKSKAAAFESRLEEFKSYHDFKDCADFFDRAKREFRAAQHVQLTLF